MGTPPMFKAGPSAIAALICALAACAAPAADGPSAPREIRVGAAETAAQNVERGVSEGEVAAAVQAMIAAAPVCFAWPTLWLQDGGRRTLFIARYDLMARDWGAEIASSSLERMEEFVAAGFLTRRARDELGPGAVEYALTPAGDAIMTGSPYSGERPSFCAPAERRLLAVTATEWGQFDCGNMRVRFTHVGEGWPSWAQAETMRARLAQSWPAPGAEAQGAVTFARRWISSRNRQSGLGRGELASMCFDANRARVIGDDLVLFSGG
ncbi:MAG: hypothetical protein NVV62_02675 [Terricaulis sp.]|nr:hypothetical protein [Terricaulis sp.]